MYDDSDIVEEAGKPASEDECNGKPEQSEPVPAMPVRKDGYKQPHRPRNLPNLLPYNAMVARTVGKEEQKLKPKAKAALDKEWQKLLDMPVPGTDTGTSKWMQNRHTHNHS